MGIMCKKAKIGHKVSVTEYAPEIVKSYQIQCDCENPKGSNS